MNDPASTQGLTPAQATTLNVLRRGGPPVIFSEVFVRDLLDQAGEALGEFAKRVGGNTLFVTKHTLAGVFGCETQFLVPDNFNWTPARARGQVAHRAIQLLVNWRGEPTPGDLVDEAISRLIEEERGLMPWLGGLGQGGLADLRAMAADHVTKFMECFPPLDPRSRPVTESSTQWPVDGPILMRGRSDLTIGRPFERESRKLIIDLKTGLVASRHREDLRFYALVETLSRQVPPRRLASFYLDSAQPVVEDVTENLLRSTLRRTLDGIHALIELRIERRQPTKTTGAPCHWCALADNCAEGTAYRRNLDDASDADGAD